MSNKNLVTLQNDRVRLQLDAQRNYCPICLVDVRAPEAALLATGTAHYTTNDGESYDEFNGVNLFDLISHERTDGEAARLTVRTSTPHFRLEKEFVLETNAPWLHVRYTLQSTGTAIQSSARKLQAPAWRFGPELENPLDAALFDFSWGRILPDGYESPPFLTFWLEGRQAGFILWAKHREVLRPIIPYDAEFHGAHPTIDCGSAALNDDAWDETYFARPYTWEFFLWPVRADEWEAAAQQLSAMRYRSWDPKKIMFPEPPSKQHAQVVWSADEIARANPYTVSENAEAGKWWHVRGENGQSLLFAQDTAKTAPLQVPHGLQGNYRIRITTGGGTGIMLRSPDANYPVPMSQGHMLDTPLYNAMLRKKDSPELDTGVWALDNSIELHATTAMYGQSIIGDVTFEPVATSNAQQGNGAPVFLAGIADAPDIAMQDGTPTDAPYSANAAEHARVGFSRIYWRADGQCCDYHTKVGTVRYPVRRTHAVFNPATLPYGMALREYDLLTAAVEAGHSKSIEVYGYMRINGFGGNVTPQFYLDHPELHDVREIANESSRLCYYLPEARRWKVEIAREVVRHQVDGLLIDTMRSPPMVDYHPAVVQAYKDKYGELPPRNMNRGYIHYGIHPLETGEEWMRWWKFRAEGFTQFGRELRAMLAEEGKPDLPIHVQVRPQMALFDGTDIQAWVAEKLMDCLLVWPNIDTLVVPDEIFDATKGKIPVRCTVTANNDPKYASAMEKVLADERYNDLTIYESNDAVWSPYHRAVIAKLLNKAA